MRKDSNFQQYYNDFKFWVNILILKGKGKECVFGRVRSKILESDILIHLN